jgi:hypothetical protein
MFSPSGFGSEFPKIRFVGVGDVAYGRQYNTYLLSSPGVTFGGGVSYGNPSWESCPGSAWIFNGNWRTESKINFSVDVPPGTKSVLIELNMDASSDCAQLLMEIDGDENTRSNFGTSCANRRYRFDISSGRHTIGIGTDQQSVTCSGDLSVDDVIFTFEGHCLEEWEYTPGP